MLSAFEFIALGFYIVLLTTILCLLIKIKKQRDQIFRLLNPDTKNIQKNTDGLNATIMKPKEKSKPMFYFSIVSNSPTKEKKTGNDKSFTNHVVMISNEKNDSPGKK